MASKSKAPDITERVVIDLSGRTSQYYELNANAFDVAIGGLPFIMAVTDNTPYKRQTADFRAQRVDQMRDPGEHTLAGSGYWTRSQSSFHYGEGINFTEPMEGNDSEVRFRYKDGYGVNPWTPGQLSLLKKTTLVQAFPGACKLDTGATNGTDFLVATNIEAPIVTTGTIKKCIPVFDAITAGYIITSPADIWVSVKEGNVQYFEWADYSLITFHPINQAENHPARKPYQYPKWENYWSVRTPKGYSTLFVQPFHRESVFTILPGIVDTDTYYAPVNFPMVINDPKWEGLIPKGTPIAQVIPFKRDNFKMKIGNKKDFVNQSNIVKELKSKIFDRYKTMYWNRKEYK